MVYQTSDPVDTNAVRSEYHNDHVIRRYSMAELISISM